MSAADDSLLDVEQHIAEIESYLASGGGGGAGVAPSSSPPAVSAYAAHEQNMRQYEMARSRSAQQPLQSQNSGPPAAAPVYPISAVSSSITPREPPSLNSSISSASASLRSSAAASARRPHADFDSFQPQEPQRHDHLNSSGASGFSTPSTISSASGMGSARRFDAAPVAAMQHDYDDEEPPQQQQQQRSARSVVRSAQATPHTERSAVVVPVPAYAEDTDSTAAAAAAANAAEKQRIVAQLLAQHRQAQVTGRAATSRVSPASASLASAAAMVAPAQVSSIVVPPVQLRKSERDEMVERLLQQRRKQKEAEEAAAKAAAATPVQQQRPQPAVKPYSYDAPLYDRPVANPPAAARASPAVAATSAAVAASRFQPKSQLGRYDAPPLPPDDDEPFLEEDDSNADASVLSSSGMLLDQTGPPLSPSGESFHSTHSSIARSRSGDSEAASDVSTSSSSPDPRFHGQTLFEASEYLNEDGTSIIHDTSASYPEQVQEGEEDDGRDSTQHTEDEGAEEERSAEMEPERKYSAPAAAVAIIRKPSAARDQPPSKPFSPATAQRFGKDAAVSSAAAAPQPPPQTKPAQQKVAVTHLNQRARRTKSKSRSPVRATQSTAAAASGAAPKRSSSLVRRPTTAPRPTAASQAHAAANASRYSRASIEAEIERERAEMCTFTPTFVSRPLLDQAAGSMQERLDVWQRRQTAALNRKLEQKREYEEEKLQECTFAPAINPTSAHVASRSAARQQEPVAERLHHEADQRAILRERAKRLSEEEMLAGLPFAPQLSTTSRKVVERAQAKAAASAADGTGAANAAKPLYQRVAELQRRKNERLHAALLASRTASGADSDFKPSINAVSEKLAREREEKERQARKGAWEEVQRQQDAIDDPAGSSGPAAVSARLAGAGSNALVTQRMRQANQALEATMRAHTFKPEVNPVSEQLLKTSRVFAGPAGKDFVQRQQRLQALSRAAAAERASADASQSGLTFKPDIGNADQILQASKQRHAEAAAAAARAAGLDAAAAEMQHQQQVGENETPEEAAARLSSQDSRALGLLKTKLRVLHETQQGLTFTPEISAVSRKLAANRAALAAAALDAGEPHPDSAEARAAVATLLAEHSAQEFAASHPFAPKLNATSQEMVARGLVAPHYSSKDMRKLSSQIREDAVEKDQKLAAIARAAALKELSECTFDPSAAAPLGRLPRASKEPVLVRGMNRFLELKALRKRMEDEQAARERKVFMLDIAESGAKNAAAAATTGASTTAAGDIDRGTEDAHRLGYTVPQPFHLSHAARSKERSAAQERVQRDADARSMQECSWAPVTNATHNRQILQHVLQQEDEPIP